MAEKGLLNAYFSYKKDKLELNSNFLQIIFLYDFEVMEQKRNFCANF